MVEKEGLTSKERESESITVIENERLTLNERERDSPCSSIIIIDY